MVPEQGQEHTGLGVNGSPLEDAVGERGREGGREGGGGREEKMVMKWQYWQHAHSNSHDIPQSGTF